MDFWVLPVSYQMSQTKIDAASQGLYSSIYDSKKNTSQAVMNAHCLPGILNGSRWHLIHICACSNVRPSGTTYGMMKGRIRGILIKLYIKFYTVKQHGWSLYRVHTSILMQSFQWWKDFRKGAQWLGVISIFRKCHSADWKSLRVSISASLELIKRQVGLMAAPCERSDLFVCAHIHSSGAGAGIRNNPRYFPQQQKKAAPGHVSPAKLVVNCLTWHVQQLRRGGPLSLYRSFFFFPLSTHWIQRTEAAFTSSSVGKCSFRSS